MSRKKYRVPCYLASKERGAATVFVAEIRAISTSIPQSKMHAVSSGEVHIGLTTTPSNSDVCLWTAKAEECSVHVVFESAAKRPVLCGVIPRVCDQWLQKSFDKCGDFYNSLPSELKTLPYLRRWSASFQAWNTIHGFHSTFPLKICIIVIIFAFESYC
jgi:hypothetical protein